MEDIQAKKLRDALERHSFDFRGILWQPRRLVQTNTVALIMEVVGALVTEVEGLPLEDLPTSSKLLRLQHDIDVAWEKVKRNRLYNQADFFGQVGVIFDKVGVIFEELARLERMGLLDPELSLEK